jgi:hypothetical protein
LNKSKGAFVQSERGERKMNNEPRPVDKELPLGRALVEAALMRRNEDDADEYFEAAARLMEGEG